MPDWEDYTADLEPDAHTVVGALRLLRDLHSPQLDNARDVLVWLPPSYHDTDRRYPVLYMHDGQNLFDAGTSFAGEWEVDETLTRLADEGIEAIVVGLANTEQRRSEYQPPGNKRSWLGPAQGDAYLDFVVNTVKPMVDADFRTLPDRAHTAMAGSSMGGLISLYALYRHPELFSMIGAFSPALWFTSASMAELIRKAGHIPARIYLDVGTAEGGVAQHLPEDERPREVVASQRYVESVVQVRNALLNAGYIEGESLVYVEAEDAGHNEPAWAARLPDALRFLLGPVV